MSRSLRIAVIGSGPSGIYAADALVSQADVPVEVDIIDRLPVPFGLVRYGVAPDHLSIRSVRDTLDKTLDKPGVRFLGNVTIGQDLSVADLHALYDAVIFTYGASRDRRLGIDGRGPRRQRRRHRLRRLVLRPPRCRPRAVRAADPDQHRGRRRGRRQRGRRRGPRARQVRRRARPHRHAAARVRHPGAVRHHRRLRARASRSGPGRLDDQGAAGARRAGRRRRHRPPGGCRARRGERRPRRVRPGGRPQRRGHPRVVAARSRRASRGGSTCASCPGRSS